MSHFQGSDHVVRILEIGLGTGGTTGHLVPFLREHHVEYVFTDISEYFLRHAVKTKFASEEMMHFRLLNVEDDVEEQGFALNQFDIVLATNVIHATKNLQDTLGNGHKLVCSCSMRPRGRAASWTWRLAGGSSSTATTPSTAWMPAGRCFRRTRGRARCMRSALAVST